MTWLFTQVWLWSLAAFLLGSVITWLLFGRPLKRRLDAVSEQLNAVYEHGAYEQMAYGPADDHTYYDDHDPEAVDDGGEPEQHAPLDLFEPQEPLPRRVPRVGQWPQLAIGHNGTGAGTSTLGTPALSETDVIAPVAVPAASDAVAAPEETAGPDETGPHETGKETPQEDPVAEIDAPAADQVAESELARPGKGMVPGMDSGNYELPVPSETAGEWIAAGEQSPDQWSGTLGEGPRDVQAVETAPEPADDADRAARLSGQLKSLFEPVTAGGQPQPYVPPVGAEVTQSIPRVADENGRASEDEQVTTEPRNQGSPSTPPSGYEIKGHFASRQYHTPESPHYDRIIAEVWFRSPSDAEQAGFDPWDGSHRG